MEKLRNWFYGVLATALVSSGAWAWGYAFSTESRLTKVETIQESTRAQQEDFRNRTDKTLDKLDARTQKMEEYLRDIHARTIQQKRQQISGNR